MTKVLVIDDDRDMCLLLKKFLERNNYEVIDFTSGKKALAWYDENKPDIVLCDLRLEDLSGLEVLKKMKLPLHKGLVKIPLQLRLIQQYGIDPAQCPCCRKKTLQLVQVYNPCLAGRQAWKRTDDG